MYHIVGAGSVTAFASSAALPDSGTFWLVGRLMLDGAGALFALYLVALMALLIAGCGLRR